MEIPHADYPPLSPPNVATGPHLLYHDDPFSPSPSPAPSPYNLAITLQTVLMVSGAVFVFALMCWRWSAVQRASLACCRICCDGDVEQGAGGEVGILGGDDGECICV